ncbi:MAG: cold-shock protein [Cellvibrionaceae bacterium]|nr:cold-shock protein [Cellvibrionaceae bacterium]MCV6625120.1 cold-shock protein [Cellvibrionaceae bacterium]
MSDRASGTVKWFNNARGYGFITRGEGSDDVFVHYRSIRGEGYRSLAEGQKVEFDLQNGDKGLQAEDVVCVVD